jgi:hypothetical protein
MDQYGVGSDGSDLDRAWQHDVHRLADHFPSVELPIIERLVRDTYTHLAAFAGESSADDLV